MHRYFVVTILFGVLLCETGIQNQTTTAGPLFNEDALQTNQVETPWDLKEKIEKVFTRRLINRVFPLTNKKIEKLETSADPTIALSAAWERVRRTIPKKESNQVYTPDKEAFDHFLQIVAERTETSIPDGWGAVVMSTTARHRGNIRFEQPDFVKEASETQLVLKGQQASIEKKLGESANLLIEDLEDVAGFYPTHVENGVLYIARYFYDPSSYQLLALDPKTTQAIWSSKVWAAEAGIINCGGICIPWHHAEFHTTEDTLVIFGVTDAGFYVEIFDKKTGENLCRFSSAYLRDVGVE